MLLGMSEILANADKLKTKKEKIEYLQRNGQHIGFKMLLKMNFDKNLVWDLPPDTPPYKELSENMDQHGMLYQEMRKMYNFHRGGNPNLRQTKRESLFIQLLESIQPDDAKLVLAVKDKKLTKIYKTLNDKIISEAFPGLLVY